MPTRLIKFDDLSDAEWIDHGNSEMVVLDQSGDEAYRGMAFQATVDPNSKALTIQRRYSFDMDDPAAAIAPSVRILAEGAWDQVVMSGVTTDPEEFLANRDRQREAMEAQQRQLADQDTAARLGVSPNGLPGNRAMRRGGPG